MQIDMEANTTIGENSFFEGKFAVKGSLRIDGKFEGQALLVDQLQVGASAKVKTNIHATSIVVEGIIIGNITASKRILLLSSARVLGDIKTPELIIQDGVVLEGKCTISHVEIENTKTYIENLYNKGTS
ncbi:MAG: polymer-forming cytoskeletal protein [Spirochaetales bacterium]|nr:polymer-forming cytoskeletal protein [Spirochaetales bacterium]